MSSAWYVNTNDKYCDNEGIDNMLKEGVICAYGDAMNNINPIRVGDMIFLYQNKIGVVSIGIALNVATDAKNIEGVNEQWWQDETRALKVSWLNQCAVSPSNPISIKLLRQFWINPFFNTTCTSMDVDYKKLFEIISKRMK
jgi:hypothetical protein